MVDGCVGGALRKWFRLVLFLCFFFGGLEDTGRHGLLRLKRGARQEAIEVGVVVFWYTLEGLTTNLLGIFLISSGEGYLK